MNETLNVDFDVVIDWYDRPIMVLMKTTQGCYVGLVHEESVECLEHAETWLITKVPQEEIRDLLSYKIDVNKYFREGEIYEAVYKWTEEGSSLLSDIELWKNVEQYPFDYEEEGEGYLVEALPSYFGWISNVGESDMPDDFEKIMEVFENE
jgi:hypothetical protein